MRTRTLSQYAPAGVLRSAAVALCLLMGAAAPAYAQSAFEDPGVRGASGSGGIMPVEPKVSGGTIAIGSTAQVVVLFKNEGGRPVSSGAINMYPSSNVSPTVTLNECAQEPLPGGAQCAIAVSIKALQAGPWRVEMLMRHDGRSKLVTTTIEGTVEAGTDGAAKAISDVEAIPDEMDYGTLAASRVQLKSVLLRNVTSNPITIGEIFVKANDASGLTQENDCKTLNSGQACVVSIMWSPKQKGPASGVLVVRHNGPTGVTTVDIKGEYKPESSVEAQIFPEAVPGEGLLLSSLTEINFGEEVQTASSITTSLVNSGDAPLTLGDMKVTGSDNGLQVEKSGCKSGAVLKPLEACPLTITWHPVRSGDVLDDVKIYHSGARGVLVLPIRGTAQTAVSKDSQAIVLNAAPGFALDYSDLQDPADPMQNTGPSAPSSPSSGLGSGVSGMTQINKAQALDGYAITSMAGDRAIITSPRGSRVIYNLEPVMIGGVTWKPLIQYSGVEFSSGEDKILILFDRSLSSFNAPSSKLGGGEGGVISTGGSSSVGGLAPDLTSSDMGSESENGETETGTNQ